MTTTLSKGKEQNKMTNKTQYNKQTKAFMRFCNKYLLPDEVAVWDNNSENKKVTCYVEMTEDGNNVKLITKVEKNEN
jgi:hypothetical protein